MKHVKHKKRGVKRILIPVLFLICCIGFGVSAWHFFTALFADRQADKAYHEIRDFAWQETEKAISAAATPAVQTLPETEPPIITAEELIAESRQFSVDIAGLKKEYPELVAWLRAEGTGIDYPVMQAKDNDFYLTHLYDGSYNLNGSLFADSRNTGVLTDGNTVIYGHNMRDGGMFNPLNEYKAQDFYDTHPTMTICTVEGDYQIDLICGTVENGDEEFMSFEFKDYEEMSRYLELIKARSTFESGVELQPGDCLVSFCTCSYETQNARYMLVGRVSGKN